MNGLLEQGHGGPLGSGSPLEEVVDALGLGDVVGQTQGGLCGWQGNTSQGEGGVIDPPQHRGGPFKEPCLTDIDRVNQKEIPKSICLLITTPTFLIYHQS